MSSPPLNQVQVLPNGQQPYSTQMTFGGLIGMALDWNPSLPEPTAEVLVNNALRSYYDRRLWYGGLRKGVIQSPGYYSQGTISLTTGSTTVTGANTNWPFAVNGVSLIGMQLRVGFNNPIYSIVGANLTASPQTLTLDLPWAMPSMTNTGYFLAQYYYVIQNCKYLVSMVNPPLMYRLVCNVPQQVLDTWDPSRLTMMWPRVAASMPPDQSGNFRFELWPVASTPQGYPFTAYVVMQNLVNDTDPLPPYIRADIVQARTVADALLYRPKNNPNYSEQSAITIAQQKLKEYEGELIHAAQMDECLWRADVVRQEEMFPMLSLDGSTGNILGGSMYAAMSATSYDY